jgi:hypothetical protein
LIKNSSPKRSTSTVASCNLRAKESLDPLDMIIAAVRGELQAYAALAAAACRGGERGRLCIQLRAVPVLYFQRRTSGMVGCASRDSHMRAVLQPDHHCHGAPDCTAMHRKQHSCQYIRPLASPTRFLRFCIFAQHHLTVELEHSRLSAPAKLLNCTQRSKIH